MSSLINKTKKSLPYLAIILIILNLFFFFSTNQQNTFDEDRIVKILSENKSILPRILDKLEVIEEQNNKRNISLYYEDLIRNDYLFLGNKNGKDIIIEFFDYNCGYCLKFHQQVISVLNEDQNTKLVVMQMPILGENSITLSKIAIAASFQNKFEEVHSYLYSPERKSKMADILGDLFLMNIDITQLEKDINSEEVAKVILSHEQFVNEFKFNGTPAIIIGETIIPGYIEKDKIIEILENEFS